jgi:ferric-dicitrate binding protein FerR (iron transport regulator)
MNISGVFDTGDAAAFVEAVQSYLPATADYADSDTIRLRMK